ncbi:MAG: ABC transporter permease [Burkholderiaceae bacterium]
MPKFVFLATDVVLLLLIAAIAFYIWHVRRTPQLAATWRPVFRDPGAMASLTVLSAFLLMAAVDSIHFRPLLAAAPGAAADAAPAYSTKTLSALDLALGRAMDAKEKTYSPPLAIRSFDKESVLIEGKPERVYPRLTYGGAHLADEAERGADLAARSAAGLGAGALVCALLWLGVAAARARRNGLTVMRSAVQVARGESEIPWRAVVITASLILLFAGWAIAVWPHYHVFGTDKTGNDVLYQALKSVRTAIVIGTLATLATLPFAIVFGITAGFFRGWIDDVIQYLYTTLSAIPSVLLIAAAVLMIQVFIDKNPQMYETGLERADVRLFLLAIIIGVTGWATLARLLRAETLKISQLDYVQAAHAFGVSNANIMRRHVFPNVMHIVLIMAVLDFSGIVLYEAVLSYVGVGVDPTTNSFGSMINAGRGELSRNPVVWWNLATAFVFMIAMVLAANLFAGAVREAFDPRARAFRIRRAKPVVPAQEDGITPTAAAPLAAR